MSNFIDRIQEWADRQPNETLGEHWFRAFLALLYISFGIGLLCGLMLGAMAGDYAIHHLN